MRIAERDPISVQQAEEEPKDDLPVAGALRLAAPADHLEALSLDVLRHEHTPARKIGVDARHGYERMPARQALDPALVLGLELVVQLFGDTLAHLRGQRLGI